MYPLDLSPTGSSKASGFGRESPSYFTQTNGITKNIELCANRREKDLSKRGRPRADILTYLMVEGSSSRSRIRCPKCSRVFPREKSLQAHLRTHTGERPYTCDYPNCTKAFCQSGQLKTHQRLHTGEKPFACLIEGCPSRFTHANRHCSQHPYSGLKRLDMDLDQVSRLLEEELNPEIKLWLSKYLKQCTERTLPKSIIKRSSSTETMEDTVIKTNFINGNNRTCSLPRIHSPYNLSVLAKSSKATDNFFPLVSDVTASSKMPRQSSGSSTKSSSSSGVYSMSSCSPPPSTSASPTSLVAESRPEPSSYIYSSQLILQEQLSETYPLPSLLPQVPASFDLVDLSMATFKKQKQFPISAILKPPSPSAINEPLSLTKSLPLLSTNSLHNTPNKCSFVNLQLSQISESGSTPNSKLMNYRMPPKLREKDRYLSALALIELSNS